MNLTDGVILKFQKGGSILFEDICAIKSHTLGEIVDLGYDTFKFYLRWVTKFRLKERIMFRLKRKQWDGYYYIGLDEKDHNIINKQGKKKHFKNIYLTKIKKELYHNKIVKHIWRVPWPTDCGWKFFLEKLNTDQAEYIGENLFELYHDCFQGKYKDLQ